MKRKSASISINLIPKDPFFESFLGKTLQWSVKVGRYIVMFTELVVIISFATRFSLDRQVTDLNDAIRQKEAVVQSYGNLETEIRAAQKKIEQYQQLQQQTNLVEVFPALSEITPADIKLTELSIKPTTVSLTGITLSQPSLNLLINNIQLSPDFFNVAVDRIETSEEKGGGLLFKITAATVKPETKSGTQRQSEKVNILDRTQGL